MSGHRRTARVTWLFGLTLLLVMGSPGLALAQQVNITPESSITPTDEITSWVFQMAIGVAILGGLALVGVLAGYLRFAPRFFGREGPKAPPGARPRLLPTMSGRPPGTVAPVPGRTGTAAATRPAPEPRREPAPAATAAAPTTPEVAPAEPRAASQAEPQAVEATARPTAPPAGEQATQADAVGQAEAAAPESRPSAKTREETGDMEAAPAPEATAEATESPAPSTEAPAQAPTETATAAPAEAPATSRSGGAMDQETYSRVLQEQLDKGVDRRVAEGRARAAGVVAAKKKSQG